MADDRDKQSAGAKRSLPVRATLSYGNQGNGNTGADWFGPLMPMAPAAPISVKGRILDYQAGYNLQSKPRQQEALGYEALRGFADSYDLLRLIIETRKDQLGRMRWNIVPREHVKKQRKSEDAQRREEKLTEHQKQTLQVGEQAPSPVAKADTPPAGGLPAVVEDEAKKVKAEVVDPLEEKILEIERFFIRPDKEHFWDEWLRMLLEDLFVIDAPTLYRRKTYGGELFALEPIDGATIKRVIDQWGRTPTTGPAYQQVLKGFPAVDYTKAELLYRPRNMRTHKIYGFSPVEQIVMTVNIAMRRQIWQLQSFTEGNLPEALIGTPAGWTPDQIKQFQDYFDSMLVGNTGERRRAKFVPGELAKGYVPTKPAEIFQKEAEEWLARVVCYCFSVSPQPFIQMMNRATAETAQETAVSDGLAPLQGWIKGLIDTIIIEDFECEDLEFEWADEDELDPNIKSQILDRDFKTGRLTYNEVRQEQGKDPVDHPNADRPMALKADGTLVPLFPTAAEEAQAAEDKARQHELETMKATKVPAGGPEAPGGTSPGQDEPSKTPAAAPAAAPVAKMDVPWYEEDLAKRFDPSQHPRYPKGDPDGGKFAPKDGGMGGYPEGTSDHVKSVMTPEQVQELRRMVDEGATADEIFKQMQPLYNADDAGNPTLVIPPDGHIPPDFFVGRTYALPDGSHTDLEGAIEHLMKEGDAMAGPNGPGFDRKAIMLIGPPAAGKSTLAERLASNGYAIVDADEAKKLIPGYNGGLGAQAVHEESSAMSKIVQAQYANTGKNVLIQTTSHSAASAGAKIEALQRAGYKVDVIGMAIDGDEATRRMASRAIKTGRSVPREIMEHAPVQTMNTFEAVKGTGNAYARIDAGGDAPVVRESSVDWLTPGKPVLGKSRDGVGAVLPALGDGGLRPSLQKTVDAHGPLTRYPTCVKRRWQV